MVVGFVDSPFDAPRLTLLIFLVVVLCVAAYTASIGQSIEKELQLQHKI